MDGWTDGWMEVKYFLWIACFNKKERRKERNRRKRERERNIER